MKILAAWFLLVLCLLPGVEYPGASFSQLPVLHSGRVKPLDTVARHYLLAFSGKSSLRLEDKTRLKAITWLSALICEKPEAHDWRVFQIYDVDVSKALGLKQHEKFRYSFNEVRTALIGQREFVQGALNKEDDERDRVEQHMVEVYRKVAAYQGLVNSMTCLLPRFTFTNPELAADLSVEVGATVTYRELLLRRQAIQRRLTSLQKAMDPNAELSPSNEELFRHAMIMKDMKTHSGQVLAVVPDEVEDELWRAPWHYFSDASWSNGVQPLLAQWETVLRALDQGDVATVEQESQALLATYGADEQAQLSLLKWEGAYNDRDPFLWSIVCYILALVLLAITGIKKGVGFHTAAFVCVVLGLLSHIGGISARSIIMQRPPVGTLYEAILFTGAVSALSGVVLECFLRNKLGIFLAASLGLILQLVGIRYAAEGDTMGMLVAVLNSNFWLTTHVLTIVAGYGFAYIACLIGHVALVQHCIDGTIGKKLYRLMHVSTVFALFFVLFGTILGGIWADQSWGRFWGWDPKENGALWIVMWLLFVLHARLSGVVADLGFAALLSLVGIIVSLAFWGVNLLNVGLHSYGFDDGAFWSLSVYTILELVVVGVLTLIAIQRQSRLAKT